MVYTCPNRKSFTRARATPRTCAVSSPRPPSAHALSLFSLFYALGAHLLNLERLIARTKSHCALPSAHRAPHLALPRRVRHARTSRDRLKHIFGSSCSSAHLSTLIEQLPTSSLKRLHLNLRGRKDLKSREKTIFFNIIEARWLSKFTNLKSDETFMVRI